MIKKKIVKKKKPNKTGKNGKHPGGRPLFDGKDEDMIVGKLKEVWALGGTDEEACLFANISMSALYDYQKGKKKFLEKKALLKQTPFLLARTTVVNNLKDDKNLAWDFLKHAKKKEFGPEPMKIVVEDATRENIKQDEDKES